MKYNFRNKHWTLIWYSVIFVLLLAKVSVLLSEVSLALLILWKTDFNNKISTQRLWLWLGLFEMWIIIFATRNGQVIPCRRLCCRGPPYCTKNVVVFSPLTRHTYSTWEVGCVSEGWWRQNTPAADEADEGDEADDVEESTSSDGGHYKKNTTQKWVLHVKNSNWPSFQLYGNAWGKWE